MLTFTLPKLHISSHALGGLESRISNTPLLPLHHISKELKSNVKVYVKAEWFNPSGSIKDRPAINIIRNALRDGFLSGNNRLLDSTSGNMGISYATFCAPLGIKTTLVIPANASHERIKILSALGAELILTDPLEGSDGAILVARQLALEYPERYFYANQYDNPANWQAHYFNTAPEIVNQTNSEITHFVAGLGTTGTFVGVARFLREFNPDIQLYAVQPNAAFHGLEGLKHIQSAITPGIFDPSLPDGNVEISTEQAHQMTRRLAREEGMFTGISSGAASYAALKIASKLDKGVVVTILPDAGHKYLSDEELWKYKGPGERR